MIDQIEQAAGRGDENIDALTHLPDLPIDRHTAEHHRDGKPQELAVIDKALRDLACELAGRRKDQHAARAGLALTIVLRETVQRRQREGSGLAGAGLGDTAKIAAIEQCRDRLSLDRRRHVIALGGQCLEDRLGKAKL